MYMQFLIKEESFFFACWPNGINMILTTIVSTQNCKYKTKVFVYQWSLKMKEMHFLARSPK